MNNNEELHHLINIANQMILAATSMNEPVTPEQVLRATAIMIGNVIAKAAPGQEQEFLDAFAVDCRAKTTASIMQRDRAKTETQQ